MNYDDLRPLLNGYGRKIQYFVPMNIYSKTFSPYSYIKSNVHKGSNQPYIIRNQIQSLSEGEVAGGLLSGYGRKMDFDQKFVYRGYFAEDTQYGKTIRYRYGRKEGEGIWRGSSLIRYEAIDSFITNTDP